MTGREFFTAFKDIVKVKDYASIYSSNKDFTQKITKAIGTVLKQNGLEVNYEYYNVDVIGWQYSNTDDKFKALKKKAKMTGNRKPWQLSVAVEHENNQKDWIYELIKIAQFSCSLKVVIGYTPYAKREEIEAERIAYAAECLKASSYSLNGEYLLILGCCEKEEYSDFEYRGYLFDGKAFIRI